ncbi:hypothetical protein PRIPAC_82308 [Pristionchus pacificus]|uniref:Uncharacterized protein n=1 Tax=Pristionchus pacificus TaxID=54126 RepID=A0A2A6CNA6_PRIPA|nr:hypothetical protein PRIPAC_82308 [Pristionchus pacificus]|eukprot:PDM79682.1 hypothetical protein PRIPAC_32261 [Pristionchus pacificus]
MHRHGTALLMLIAASTTTACIPTKTPQPGIPAMPTPAPCDKTCSAPAPEINDTDHQRWHENVNDSDDRVSLTIRWNGVAVRSIDISKIACLS